MADPQKFMFTVRFDTDEDEEAIKEEPTASESAQVEETGEEKEEELPPPPTYSQEDLDEAVQAAHALGHANAYKKAETSIEKHTAEALDKVAVQLQEVQTVQDKANEENAAIAAHAALTVIKKLLPHWIKTHGPHEIEHIIEEILPILHDEPQIRIQAHPETLALLETQMEDVKKRTGYLGHIVYQPNPKLSETDTTITWHKGGVDRRMDRLMARVEEIMEENIPMPNGKEEDIPASAPEKPTPPKAAPAAAETKPTAQKSPAQTAKKAAQPTAASAAKQE